MKNILITLVLFCSQLFIHAPLSAQPTAAQLRFRRTVTDTSDIYSRNPSRPFRYGYPYDKSECLKYFGLLSDAGDFHEGDTIAEVGAASGWIEGVLSVLCDSLTLFAEDIDTDYLSQDQFDSVKAYFGRVRGRPQTNKLYYIIGSPTYTFLPERTFDKIFINNAFHEIRKPRQMLADIKGKLKPEGTLIIADEFSSPYTDRRAEGCETRVWTVERLCRLMAKTGLYLCDRKAPAYARDNILIFSQDSARSNQRLKKIAETYDADIQMLEHQDRIDTGTITSVYKKIFPQIPLIKAVYPLLDKYLVEMVKNYSKKEDRREAAYNVARLAITMYPDKEKVCEAYGIACARMGFNDIALQYFKKAAWLSDHPEDYAHDVDRYEK